MQKSTSFIEPTAEEQKSEELAQEIEEEHIERLLPFAFSKSDIPVGATFTCRGNTKTCVKSC